jgi:hypothetical protein
MSIPPQLSLKEGERERENVNASATGAESARGTEIPTENGSESAIVHENIAVES